ncbi:MAG: N-acetylglucosamine-6-phosphate deacetylase [Pirellulales bacterium]
MAVLDLQLNGYRGIDFNADDLSVEQLSAACQAVRADGGHSMLATVITDRLDLMKSRIERLAHLREQSSLIAEIMVGIHVEGPFISPTAGYVGAHPAEYVLPATVVNAKELVSAGRGLIRIMTLAPEYDNELKTTQWLAEQNILVSAGHCNPSAEVFSAAMEAGLSAFTHLGNGCPLHLHRHDNIIHRVLAADGLRWVMMIPDGIHLPPPLMRTMIRSVGIERIIAVSDATAAGGMGAGHFSLGSQEIVVEADGAAWASDRTHLVGSTASMKRVREVLEQSVGLTQNEIVQITEVNPAIAIG